MSNIHNFHLTISLPDQWQDRNAHLLSTSVQIQHLTQPVLAPHSPILTCWSFTGSLRSLLRGTKLHNTPTVNRQGHNPAHAWERTPHFTHAVTACWVHCSQSEAEQERVATFFLADTKQVPYYSTDCRSDAHILLRTVKVPDPEDCKEHSWPRGLLRSFLTQSIHC